MLNQNEKTFVADIFGAMPEELETLRVRMASQYVMLLHLVRTPVVLDKSGLVAGDLFQKWKVSPDKKEFTFTLKKSQKWSDGSQILPSDFVKTFKRQILSNNSTHFDFSTVESVDLTKDGQFRVKLKKKNSNFIFQLTHPEFGVVRVKNGAIDLTVTSGPFSLAKHSVKERKFYFIRNNFYPLHDTKSPKQILFQAKGLESQISGLVSGEIDFVVPAKQISVDKHKIIVKSPLTKVVSPKIGFTHWISLNAESNNLDNLSKRKGILKILSNAKLDFTPYIPFWQPANQLYLPDGFGRPTNAEINLAWKKIFEITKKLNNPDRLTFVTTRDFPFNVAIKDAFKVEGIALDLKYYKTSGELDRIILEREFDLLLTNNDFSSPDLLENLLVTFNTARPLVFAEHRNRRFRNLLDVSKAQEDKEKLYANVKKIGLDLIAGGNIFPVAYDLKKFYILDKYDLSNWSTLYPEISFWKLK